MFTPIINYGPPAGGGGRQNATDPLREDKSQILSTIEGKNIGIVTATIRILKGNKAQFVTLEYSVQKK